MTSDSGNGSPTGEDRAWRVLRLAPEALAEAGCWPAVAESAAEAVAAGERCLIVCAPLPGLDGESLLAAVVAADHVSALRFVTGSLEELGVAADELPTEGTAAVLGELGRLLAGVHLLGEAGPRVRARIGAIGAVLPVPLFAAWLRRHGVDAAAIDPREILAGGDWGGHTDRDLLAADCAEEATPELLARVAEAPPVVVVAGGVGRGATGDAVLLEGGADRAAACLAAQLGASRFEAWGEPPGLFTADPRRVPGARLLRSLGYEEAVELLTSAPLGLHPRAVGPLRRAGISLRFRSCLQPGLQGTEVHAAGGGAEPRVKAVTFRGGVMLLSLETAGMWQRVGFLSEVFAVVARHGLSVDLVSTAEADVTLSFDPSPPPTPERLAALVEDLWPLGRARVIGPCAAVTLVGRQIRSILHRLGPLLEVFEERPVHLLTQAATDLNLTFVVDEAEAERLVRELHDLLLRRRGGDELLGPTVDELRRGQHAAREAAPETWWRRKRAALLDLAERSSPAFVYDTEELSAAAARILALPALDRVLYAVKANPNPGVLRALRAAGVGFETVSPGEVEHVLGLFPDLSPGEVLFTPNFAPRREYEDAFARGVRVTVDNLWPLREWPETFAGREVFLRLDPGHGRGHHKHVRTAGEHSKFGIPLAEAEEAARAAAAVGARVVGLHAHTGSGILEPDAWREVAGRLLSAAELFPEAAVLDLGGGLGVGELPQEPGLDVTRLGELLAEVKEGFPRYALWLEPGRWLVARAGVLLARVTQLKGKGGSRFVGVETGMNSLIRPALYGAWHEIVNLTRLDEPAVETADVVGPICESGDVLGHERRLPPCAEGDVLLVANAGAYGRAMSSRYNLREPAAEHLI